MSGLEPPIGEVDLHAFVDNQLPKARHAAVQRYLYANQQEAYRVAAWMEQREALRLAAALEPETPLPPGHDLSRLIETQLRRRQTTWLWLTAASVLFALALGGAGGWLLRLPYAPGRDALALTLLEQQGLATHVVYAADKRHPIEVAAVERDHLTQWLSNRLNRTVAPPELETLGYRLIGGRLLATERGGPAALLMYEDVRGQRLSLVLRPMARNLHAARADMSEGELNGCAWIANGLGYAVVSALPDEELDRIADHVRLEWPAAG